MSIVFFDGFDLYSAGADLARRGWVPGSAPLGSMQTGRFANSRAIRLTSSNANKLTLGITSTGTIAFGFAFKTDNLASYDANGKELAWFRNGATDILKLGITNDGRLRLGRGDFTTNLVCGSAPAVIAANSFYYIEGEITRNASTGAATIYVNGVSVATASGANTGASDFDGFALSSGFANQDYDDLYLCNVATKLGEMRVEVCRPSAETATADFTPSTGTDNSANVDDTQFDDDATYNSSATVGHKDLFDMTNLSAAPVSIKAVQPILCARKDNASARTTRFNMKNGSTTTNGTTTALGTSYSCISGIYETNPDTSAAWTNSDISATQLGYEVVA